MAKTNHARSVESWPTGRLVAYSHNARIHDDAQVEAIATSIRRFGFQSPILATPEGQVVAGHGRLLAAKQLGLVEVPVVVVHGLSTDEVRAYLIADNKTAERSRWDLDLLAEELSDLESAGLDAIELGFTDDELAELIEEAEGAMRGDGADEEPDGQIQAELSAEPKPSPPFGAAAHDSCPGRDREQYGLLVICADEQEQESVYARLIDLGLSCRVVTT